MKKQDMTISMVQDRIMEGFKNKTITGVSTRHLLRTIDKHATAYKRENGTEGTLLDILQSQYAVLYTHEGTESEFVKDVFKYTTAFSVREEHKLMTLRDIIGIEPLEDFMIGSKMEHVNALNDRLGITSNRNVAREAIVAREYLENAGIDTLNMNFEDESAMGE